MARSDAFVKRTPIALASELGESILPDLRLCTRGLRKGGVQAVGPVVVRAGVAQLVFGVCGKPAYPEVFPRAYDAACASSKGPKWPLLTPRISQ